MDLSTRYLGLKLRNPLIVGASPFSDNTHVACQLQDAGAAAIVKAIERTLLEQKLRTGDLGGTANTESCGKAVAEML